MGTLQCCKNREGLDDPNETEDIKDNDKDNVQFGNDIGTNNLSAIANKPWINFYDSIKGKFYLEIQINTLSIQDNNYEKYGCVFHPNVEFIIESNIQKIFSINSDKVNISPKNSGTGQKTFFHFNQIVKFECTKYQFYNFLIIQVNNTIWTADDNNQSINKKEGKSPVIIGQTKIPINLIISSMSSDNPTNEDSNTMNNCLFRGEMQLFQNGYKQIGNISLIIKLTSNPNELSKNENTLLSKNDLVTSNGELFKPYQNINLHYYMLNEAVMNRVFNNPFNEQIEAAKDFIIETSKKEVFDSNFVIKTFYEFISKNSSLLGYELFIHLFNMSQKIGNIQQIDMALYEMKEDLLLKLPEKMDYNIYFMKMYLMFFHNYIDGIKSLDNATDTQIQEKSLTRLLNETTVKLKQIVEKGNLDAESMFQYQEIILWIFNILIDLLTFPKNYQKFLYESRVKETYKIFETSKDIINYISYYYYFVKEYIRNSEIVLAFVRIMRKIIQITCTNENIKDYQKETHFDVYEFKKFLIYDSNGIFISLINKISENYSHYPNMISNILQIFVTITKKVTNEDLHYFIEKLNLPKFAHCIYFYVGKLYYIFREINQLYLEFLDNESEMAKAKDYEDIFTKVENEKKTEELTGINIKYENEMILITNELIYILEMNVKNGKNLNIFSQIGENLYLIYLISSISIKITLYPKILNLLLSKDTKDNLNFFYTQFKIIITLSLCGAGQISGGDLLTTIMSINSQIFTPNQTKGLIKDICENILTMIYQALNEESTAQGVYDILDGNNEDKYELSKHFELPNDNIGEKKEDNILSDLIYYLYSKDVKVTELKKIKTFYDTMINDQVNSVSDD